MGKSIEEEWGIKAAFTSYSRPAKLLKKRARLGLGGAPGAVTGPSRTGHALS